MTEKAQKTLSDLLPDGPVYSDPFDFKGQKFKFRLLDCRESFWAEAYAQKLVLRTLREIFDDKDLALDLMKNHAPNHDLHVGWQELLALQAALCFETGAPVVTGTPEDRANQLADMFSEVERHELAQLYGEFADEHDPLEMSEEEIEALVNQSGEFPASSIWNQYGSNVLRRCLITMAARLARAEALAMKIEEAQTLTARVEVLEREISQMGKSGDGIN